MESNNPIGKSILEWQLAPAEVSNSQPTTYFEFRKPHATQQNSPLRTDFSHNNPGKFNGVKQKIKFVF